MTRPLTSISLTNAAVRILAFLFLDELSRGFRRISETWLSWNTVASFLVFFVAFRYVLGPALRIDWETRTDISEVRR